MLMIVVGCQKPEGTPVVQTSPPLPAANGVLAETTTSGSASVGGRVTRYDAINVRLDIDSMRVYGVSRDDVMRTLEDSGNSMGPSEGRITQGDSPMALVLRIPHIHRVDQYEKLIVKATPEGVVVRLNDVANLVLIRTEP